MFLLNFKTTFYENFHEKTLKITIWNSDLQQPVFKGCDDFLRNKLSYVYSSTPTAHQSYKNMIVFYPYTSKC